MTMKTVITNAEVEGRHVSVVIDDGHIVEISEDVETHNADVVDADGGALIVGLHDHHVHLLAMAARREGIDLDPLQTPLAFDDALRLASASSETGWLRASGYDEHRHGVLDCRRLDALVGNRPLRVQHRSGLAWVLSNAALDLVLDGELPDGVELDPDGIPTGWLLRLDEWIADRIPPTAPSLRGVGAELATFGITGVTDATPNLGQGRLELLRSAVSDRSLPQRLVLLGVDDPAAVADFARVGPAKIVIDEVTGLDPDALARIISAHHLKDRAVAIHAVSRAETVTAVTALALAGIHPGDRIEHGSVLPDDLDAILASGSVTVVIQPGLVGERGDHYLSSVDREDLPFLHRAASLQSAGIAVAIGSDAPVTSADPWATIATATTRQTRSGNVIGESERVDARTALGWYLTDPLDPGGSPRRVVCGSAADLCLLDAPLDEVLAAPDAMHVRMTWVGGRLVHS